jgi:uncharacterized damage-inducible protein DinB
VNSKLQQQFNLLEQTRTEIVNLLSGVDQSSFERSVHGKWSIAQILMHVITSERLAVLYMRKKSLGVQTLKNSGILEPLKLLLLQVSQRLPIKYKVPTSIRDKTPLPPPKEELLKVWEEERAKLDRFLSSIDDKHVSRMIFKHPLVGMFNAAQGVAFLREHLMHHRPQIVKLISASK